MSEWMTEIPFLEHVERKTRRHCDTSSINQSNQQLTRMSFCKVISFWPDNPLNETAAASSMVGIWRRWFGGIWDRSLLTLFVSCEWQFCVDTILFIKCSWLRLFSPMCLTTIDRCLFEMILLSFSNRSWTCILLEQGCSNGQGFFRSSLLPRWTWTERLLCGFFREFCRLFSADFLRRRRTTRLGKNYMNQKAQ